MAAKRPSPGHPILVHFGDQDLELKFTLRTLKKLEAETGISILKGFNFASSEALSKVLLYGLQAKNPDVTAEWVDDNIDGSMMTDLLPLIAYAVTGQWPRLAREPDPNEETPILTGSISKPSDDTISGLVNGVSGT